MIKVRYQFLACCIVPLVLVIPTLSSAKTAKTCPDCACVWLDANGKQSPKPEPVPYSEKSDTTNRYNLVYRVQSDPGAKKKCEGKTCTCRIIKRTTVKVHGKDETSDQVVLAGPGEPGAYRVGKFEKDDAEAKEKGGGVELIPACVLLGEDGQPEYGQPHR